MRKGASRKARPAVSPCLIAVGLNNKHEAGMIAAVQAFRRGYATVDNFLDLCDSRDITVIAYQMQKRHVDGMEAAMDATHTALMNIRDRREETGKFGASADELAALALLVDTYMNYWLAQSGDLYRKARTELYRLRKHDRARQVGEVAA